MFLPASTLRKRPGLALALAAAMGAVALPAIVLAPAASAQQPQVTVNKQMLKPLNEATAAIAAKDWATATAKINAAAGSAKTPGEHLAIGQMRFQVASGQNDAAARTKAIEEIVATNALPPEDQKKFKGALAASYMETDKVKGLAALRAYLDEYGGTHPQYSGVAVEAVLANDNATAVTYGEKAIELAKAAGEKPPENYYRTLLRAHKQTNANDKYVETVERAVVDYPTELYWKELIGGSQTAPGFSGEVRIDVYRALQQANIALTPEQKMSLAQDALKRALPNEAIQALAGVSTPEAQKILTDATDRSKGEKAGLPQEEKDVTAKGTGAEIAALGEVFYSYGDYAKAAELIKKGLDKGIPEAADAELARLHLGMAQHKAGQKEAARATWAELKSGTAVARLARVWSLLSQTQA